MALIYSKLISCHLVQLMVPYATTHNFIPDEPNLTLPGKAPYTPDTVLTRRD